MRSRVSLVIGSDWDGLFIDGKLVEEGHSIRLEDAINAVLDAGVAPPLTGSTLETVEVDYEWLEDRGSFPQKLDDVVLRST